MRLVLQVVALTCCATASAQEVDLEQLADVPPPPEPVTSGQVLEPDVTIIRRDDATVEEYRINGRLYMVQVKPDVGPSYYLVDQDGDGQLESRMDDVYNATAVPNWIIFSWD